MASATLDRLVAHFDRREHRTLPPTSPDDHAAPREQIVKALEKLEHDGKFAHVDSLGQSVLDSLLIVAEGALWDPFALHPGRSRIFAELVLNLAEPRRINQGLKGTCGAACIEGYLAERQPAEYARIITGLVTRDGRAVLRSGETLVCDEDVLGPSPHERGRNPVSRIFQASCMEFAYPNMNYDNVVDGHFDGDTNVGSGLEMDAFDRLLNAVTGEVWKTISLAHSKMTEMFSSFGVDTKEVVDIVRDGLSITDQAIRKGGQTFVSLELPQVPNPIPGGKPPVFHNTAHKVRAIGIDWNERSVHYDDPMDPERRWFDGAHVTIVDTYGHCSMPKDDFTRLMTELSYRPELWERSG